MFRKLSCRSEHCTCVCVLVYVIRLYLYMNITYTYTYTYRNVEHFLIIFYVFLFLFYDFIFIFMGSKRQNKIAKTDKVHFLVQITYSYVHVSFIWLQVGLGCWKVHKNIIHFRLIFSWYNFKIIPRGWQTWQNVKLAFSFVLPFSLFLIVAVFCCCRTSLYVVDTFLSLFFRDAPVRVRAGVHPAT